MIPTRSLMVATLVVLGACAPSNAPGTRLSEPAPSIATGSDNMGSFRINPQDAHTSRTVSAAPAVVWAALPTVFEELGIATELVQPEQLTLGTAQVTSSRVGGKRTGAYLRCGNEGAGPSAMTGRRHRMTVITSLRPEGTGTVVTARVEGSATPIDGSGGTSYCTSTGELETRIMEILHRQVGR